MLLIIIALVGYRLGRVPYGPLARGWRIERQTNSISVGLESPSTNWVTVFTAYGGTNILYYPDTNDLSTFWIRTTQRLSTTNDGPVADAIFFRALYP